MRRLRHRLGRGRPNAFVELASLCRDASFSSPRYAALCLELGLLARYREAKGGDAAIERRPLEAIRFAAAAGRRDMVQRVLERELGAAEPFGHDAERLWPLLQAGWHVCPHAVARALRAWDHPHPVSIALADRLGDVPPPAALSAARREPADADAALVSSLLMTEPAARIAALNRALALLGQAPLALRSDALPLAIGNLRAAASPSGRGAAALPVSVVMTCFNNVSHVASAIASVLGQRRVELELIVVDDGSDDGSWSVIEGCAAADVRVRTLRLPRNVGTYAAKNAGLDLARHPLVAFNDSDDWSHPDRLGLAVDGFAAEPSLVAVTGRYVRLSDQGRFSSSRVYPLLRWSPNSVIFRREPVLQRIGYLDENRFGSDSEYVARLRAAFGEPRHRRLPQLQYIACLRGDSLMHGSAYGLDDAGHSSHRRAFEEQWSERLLTRLIAGRPLYLPRNATPIGSSPS